MVCENCLKLARRCLALQGEIDALESRVDELECELQPKVEKNDVELWNEWCDL